MPELYLYEVGNGWMGESYLRVYVLAQTDQTALELAQQAMNPKYATPPEHYRIEAKVPVHEGFVSKPSDCGLEVNSE